MPNDSRNTCRLTNTLLMVCFLSPIAGCNTSPKGIPGAKFSITTERASDQIKFTPTGDGQSFTVTSQTGIGQGVINLTSGKWAHPVTLLFELNGMESLTLEYQPADGPIVKQGINVGSQDSNKVSQYLVGDDGTQTPITAGSLHAASVHTTTVNDAAQIHVTLPDHFLTSKAKSISLHWIDFYR